MELDNLFGLPAHPLVVHAAVVLLPLAALATIAAALVRKTRRYYAPVAFGLALAAVASVALAQGSGESLKERVSETELVEQHADSAEVVLPWAIALAVAAAAVTAADPLMARFGKPSPDVAKVVLVVLAVVPAIGATWAVIDVGHSGAKASWSDVGDENEG